MDLCEVKVAGNGAELKISVNGVRTPDEWSPLPMLGVSGVKAPSGTAPQRLVFGDQASSILQPIRLLENTEYDFTIRLKATVQELLSAMGERALAPFRMDSLSGVASLNSRDSWKQEEDWLLVTGRLNFRNRAGMADLSVRLGLADLSLFVDVVPAKLDYEQHFHVIVDALAKKHVELLLRLDTGVETSLEILESKPSTPLQEMIHLRNLFESGTIEHAVRLIESNPTQAIHAETLMELTPLCTDPDWMSFSTKPYESQWIRTGSEEGFMDGWSPITLPTVRKEATNDSKENRFVKHLLHVLSNRLEILGEMLSPSQSASQLALRRWQSTIQNILSKPFWLAIRPKGTMPNSMALLYRAGYRDIVRAVAELAMAVSLSKVHTLSIESGELKPVYDLYETWCFFAFCEAASHVAGTDLSQQIQLGADPEARISVTGAIRGTPLVANLQRNGQPVSLTIHYNRTFRRSHADAWQDSYSVRLRPDISLHIECGGLGHWLHFDAKYRLDTKQLDEAWATELKEDESASTFVEEDIHVMHAYRDAVLGTRGSFILYPGRESKPMLYTRHGDATYRKDEHLPSVGAFPLLPSPDGHASQELELRNFIEEAVDRLVAAAGYQEETGLL